MNLDLFLQKIQTFLCGLTFLNAIIYPFLIKMEDRCRKNHYYQRRHYLLMKHLVHH